MSWRKTWTLSAKPITAQDSQTIWIPKTKKQQEDKTNKRQHHQEKLNGQTIPEDNQHFGDKLPHITSKTFRIVYQNVNGIPSYDNLTTWRYYLQELRDISPDTTCLTETHLEINNIRQQYMEKTTRNFFSHCQIIGSTSTEPSVNGRQFGGTLTIATGSTTYRIQNKSTDPSGMGRWSSIHYRCRNGITLTITTAYRVPQQYYNPINTEYTTAVAQQWRLIRMEHPNDKNINPRQQILDDLKQQINLWQTRNHIVILCIDANESTSEKAMLNFIQSTGLTDIMRHKHGNTPLRTYQRGSKAIDHILWSSTKVSMCIATGYLPFGEGIPNSDHRCVYIDHDIDNIFKQVPCPTERPERILNSKNAENVKKFLSRFSNGIQTKGCYNNSAK